MIIDGMLHRLSVRTRNALVELPVLTFFGPGSWNDRGRLSDLKLFPRNTFGTTLVMNTCVVWHQAFVILDVCKWTNWHYQLKTCVSVSWASPAPNSRACKKNNTGWAHMACEVKLTGQWTQKAALFQNQGCDWCRIMVLRSAAAFPSSVLYIEQLQQFWRVRALDFVTKRNLWYIYIYKSHFLSIPSLRKRIIHQHDFIEKWGRFLPIDDWHWDRYRSLFTLLA